MINQTDETLDKIILTDEEKARFVQWVIENITDNHVPGDEGNEEGLIFNIVHAILGDNDLYGYRKEQNDEISSWDSKRWPRNELLD